VPQSPSQADKLAPGTVLGGRYRVESHIGSGGYASVYRAIDLQIRRDPERAIKEVTDSDAGVRRQFQLESGLLIKSSHPNIPRGYQLFEERGRLYLVMEFVRGRDLEDWLNDSLQKRRRPLDEEQVLKWAIEVCDALQVMHGAEVPIIHRDIKPANIKITPEQKPVLIDFGLAKLQTGGPTRTAAQGVSPGFAPPEQYMAKGRTDARTDIYGLGATLYACLTGKDPPEAPSRLLAETGATGQALISPRDMVRDGSISEMTDRIVVKTLELSPAARYQSAAELRAELRLALQRLSQQGRGKVVTVTCPACGRQTRADATCQHCGYVLRGEGVNPAAGKRATAAPPPALAPGSAKVPALGPKAGTAKHTVMAAAAPHLPTPIPAIAKQKRATLAPVPNQPKTPPGAEKQAAASARAAQPANQPAAVALPAAKGTGKMAAAAAAAQTSAVAVAAPPSQKRKGRGAQQGAAAQTAVATKDSAPPATPAAPAGPRSWINLRGPELSSLGKFGLGLSVVEACWGIFLLMLAGVEVVLRGYAQKPYFLMALIWLVIIAVVCTLGGQALVRPIYRRGRIGRVRRGFQAFGLLFYAMVLHAVGLWGLIVFGTGRPDSLAAIVAFVLFAVNVFVAGVLSLANTLG
jgi:serine/threonine-protein kinase